MFARGDDFLRQLERRQVAHQLGPEALAQYDRGPVGKVFLAPIADALVRLSNDFTRRRGTLTEALPGGYWQDARRLAYLFHFLPRNYVKAAWVLTEAGRHARLAEELAAKSHFTVLDIGCGPGTAALATLNFLASLRPTAFRVDIVLVEASPTAMQEAVSLLRQAADQINAERRETLAVRISSHVGDAAQVKAYLPRGGADFIWLANLLNEVTSDATAPAWVITLARAGLKPDGGLYVIEPGLHETARAAMRLRDALLEADPMLGVFAPCTADGPCRMLAERPHRDWCHVSIVWKPTPLVAQLDGLTGLRSHNQKFFYFVLRRDGKRAAEPRHGWSAWRVIGDLQREKGREKRLVCGTDRCALLTRLKRDRRTENAAFGDAVRGDILWLSEAPVSSGEGLRLPPTARVERQTPTE
ncbi:MAG: methyltransferase domain-containing protein [Chloracidobacterium sp.]|nr:methyltransferase domain-containing protein [Chloracidobacterium sp.]MDW8217583.1 small ribosomal subunit Rsm22 family protein [Acidobacteriota bacterium]